MLYLILADSGLELIPKDLGKHPSVGKNIKRFGNLGRILDISLHHSAMKSLKDTYSRGRPDIVHKFLIDSQASILNKLGLLRIFIHTYDDKLYEINPLLLTIFSCVFLFSCFSSCPPEHECSRNESRGKSSGN